MGLRSREALKERWEQVQSEFRKNCRWFRRHNNPELKTVASHGDWMNRRLKIVNHELIDKTLLQECNLELEAYDPEFRRRFDFYLTDTSLPPRHWKQPNEWRAALAGRSLIYVLAHEHQWHGNPWANLRQIARRVIETAYYNLKRAL